MIKRSAFILACVVFLGFAAITLAGPSKKTYKEERIEKRILELLSDSEQARLYKDLEIARSKGEIFDFRRGRWGMTIEEIKGKEHPNSILVSTKRYPVLFLRVPPVSIFGEKFRCYYTFEKDNLGSWRLRGGIYNLSKPMSPKDFLTLLDKMFNILTLKYSYSLIDNRKEFIKKCVTPNKKSYVKGVKNKECNTIYTIIRADSRTIVAVKANAINEKEIDLQINCKSISCELSEEDKEFYDLL